MTEEESTETTAEEAPTESPAEDSTVTPRHLWVVGIVSLLWNAGGAIDYVMFHTKNANYLANFTQEQLDYFSGFPTWAVAAWAIGVWGSILGSTCLLLRKKLAVHCFLASFVGMCVNMLYNYILTDGVEIMGGIGVVIFAMAIFLTATALLLYARAMRDRGVLN